MLGEDRLNGEERLRVYMARKCIDPLDPREDLPVGVDRPESVLVSGSVHVAENLIAGRKAIDKKFRSLRFS